MWIPALGLLLSFALQASDDPATLLRAGRFQEALSAAQSALKAHPTDARLLTIQGIAYTQIGEQLAALQSYRKALSTLPEYLPALEGAAQIEYKRNDPDAIAHLNRLLKINVYDQTAHAMRGAVYARSGKCDAAIQDFEAAPDALAQEPNAKRQEAACFFRLRRWATAEASFQQLLNANPSDQRAAYGVASAQIESGQFEQAVATLKPFPDDAQALALSANALEALGRTPDAIANLRSAILADPRRETFYTQFAELCFTYKSYQAGIDVLNAGLTQLPNSPKIYLARGILLVQQGDYDAADADFAKADKLDPKEANSSDATVLALVQANRLDEAARVLDEKLKQHPRDAELFFFKADVLNRQGNNGRSLEAARKAVELKPDFPMAHDLLASLYLQNGDEFHAIGECQAALKTDPEDAAALYRWLRILSGHHKDSDASAIAELTARWNKARQREKENDLRESRFRIVTTK